MNKFDFSIIIPVFNQEKYIQKCVESALYQEFRGTYEIIIVNDGSFDKTEQILNKFQNERLKIFNNENKGAAYSRNFGIKQARGEYIVFLDADDVLEKNALSLFYNANKNCRADIIQAPYYAIRENKGDIKLYFPLEKFRKQNGFLNIKNTKGEVLKGHFEPWGKAYNKDFILKSSAEFMGKSLAEDLPFFYKAVLSAEKILLCNKPVYYYRRGHKALKNGKGLIDSVIFALKECDKILNDYKDFKDIQKIYNKNCLKVCLFWYKKFKYLKNKGNFYAFCREYLEDKGFSAEFKVRAFINNLVDIL